MNNFVGGIGDPIVSCVKMIGEEVNGAAFLIKASVNLRNNHIILLFIIELLKKHKDVLFSVESNISGTIDILSRFYEEQRQLSAQTDAAVGADFARINKYAAIGLWTAMEVAIEDTVINILKQDKGLFQKLSGGKYASGEEYKVYKKLERKYMEIRDTGGKFSSIFRDVNINIDISCNDRIAISELNYVRNCILHRSSTIDDGSYVYAPHLSHKIGQKIEIDQKMYMRYLDACSHLSVSILDSVLRLEKSWRCGGPP